MIKNRNIKVLIIADFDRYGGTKTYFWALFNVLQKHECKMSIKFLDNSVLTDEERVKLDRLGVTYSYLPSLLYPQNKLAKRIRLHLVLQFFYVFWLSFSNYDKVIVSTGPFNFIAGSFFWGKKFYYIIHSYPYQGHSRWYKLADPFRKAWNRTLFFRRPNFITVSHGSKNAILKHLQVVDRLANMYVIHNPSNYASAQASSLDSNNVLTIGHLEDYKNPFFWLDVAKYVLMRNESARFLWIGDGTLSDRVRELIPSSFQQRIIFPGYQLNVSEWLSKTSVYFQPSIVESHGISVVDAMAHFIPCVVSNVGGLPESVDCGVTGYVVDLNVKEAGDKILHLLEDKELASVMGKMGYKKYLKEFSLSVWEKKISLLIFGEDAIRTPPKE